METIQALKLLASSRELGDNTTSAETQTLFSSEFYPADFASITFLYPRQYFEEWADSDMAKELFVLHECLLDMTPELSFRKFSKSKMTDLLTHVETLNIERASDICHFANFLSYGLLTLYSRPNSLPNFQQPGVQCRWLHQSHSTWVCDSDEHRKNYFKMFRQRLHP